MKLNSKIAYAVIDDELGWTVAPFWHTELAELYIRKQTLAGYTIVPVRITPIKALSGNI